MKRWIISLMIAGMFLGCAHVRPRLAEEDSSGARTTIRAIWEATRIFYWDKGSWPTSVEELLQARYLEIDSSVHAQWRFLLAYGPPYEIRAFSRQRVNDGEKPLRTITYNVLKAGWEGYGVPAYGEQKLTAAQRAELASGARQVIEDIWRTAQWYYNDKGSWPESVEELERERYMEVDIGVDSTWQFAIVGTPPQAIVAISKKDMSEGAGRAIEFDIASGVWRGYGQP